MKMFKLCMALCFVLRMVTFFFYHLKDLGVLRVLSCDASTPRRSSMLQEMHFRNISQRANLRKRTEEAARYLEATRYYQKTL